MPTPITIDANVNLDFRQATAKAAAFQRQFQAGFNRAGGLKGLTGDVNNFDAALGKATNRIVSLGAAAVVFNGLRNSFGALADATVEVEQALTKINVNLGQSADSLKQFGAQVFNVARQTGSTFEEAAKGAEELARQGLGAEETLKRLKDALTLSRIAGIDSATAVDSLTAAINSFNKEALTSTDVVNRFAAVDTKFAVSTKDLSEAVSRVGSAASEAGVSFNELLGVVTAVQQTTARGGATIGNALKTIFTRIGKPEVLNQLEQIGVATKDLEGNALPAVRVLQNLASVYDGLNTSQKSVISGQVAGTYQINILKAALGDLNKENSIYSRSLKEAANAGDAAAKKNEQLNKTLASSINATKVSVKQLFSSIGEQDLGGLTKQALGLFESIRKSLSGDNGEGVGKSLGEGILNGISNVLSGPALLAFGKILAKGFGKIISTIGSEAKGLLGINEAANKRVAIQQQILSLIKQSTAAEYAAFGAANGTLKQAEALLAIKARIHQTELIGTPLTNFFFQSGGLGSSKGNKPRFGKDTTPNFADPLYEAIKREKAAGVPAHQIYIDQDKRVASPSNPMGLLVANKRDEPAGGFQGVDRVLSQKGNPKTNGFRPNFAQQFGPKELRSSGGQFVGGAIFESINKLLASFNGVDSGKIKQIEKLSVGLNSASKALTSVAAIDAQIAAQKEKSAKKEATDLAKQTAAREKASQAIATKEALLQEKKNQKSALAGAKFLDKIEADQEKAAQKAAANEVKMAEYRKGERVIQQLPEVMSGTRTPVSYTLKERGPEYVPFGTHSEQLKQEEERRIREENKQKVIDSHRLSANNAAATRSIDYDTRFGEGARAEAKNAFYNRSKPELLSSGQQRLTEKLIAGEKITTGQSKFLGSRFAKEAREEAATKFAPGTAASAINPFVNRRVSERFEEINQQKAENIAKQKAQNRAQTLAAEQAAEEKFQRKQSGAAKFTLGNVGSFTGLFGNEKRDIAKLQKAGIDPSRARSLLDERIDRRRNLRGNATLAGSFLLPFASGFIDEGNEKNGGGGGTRNGQVRGGIKGALEGAAFGAIAGPVGAGIGAVVGGLIGVFGKLNKSTAELAQEFDKQAENRNNENQAIARSLQLQEEYDKAVADGTADLAVLNRLSAQLGQARAGVTSKEGRRVIDSKDSSFRITESGRLSDEASKEKARTDIQLALREKDQINQRVAPNKTELSGNAKFANLLGGAISDEDVKKVNDEQLKALQSIEKGVFGVRASGGGSRTGEREAEKSQKDFTDAVQALTPLLESFGIDKKEVDPGTIKGIAAAINSALANRKIGLAEEESRKKQIGNLNGRLNPQAFLNAPNLESFGAAVSAGRNQFGSRGSRAQGKLSFFEELKSSGAVQANEFDNNQEYKDAKAGVQVKNLGDLVEEFIGKTGRSRGGLRDNRGNFSLGAGKYALKSAVAGGGRDASQAQILLDQVEKGISTQKDIQGGSPTFSTLFSPGETGNNQGIKTQALSGGKGVRFLTKDDVANKRNGYLNRFSEGPFINSQNVTEAIGEKNLGDRSRNFIKSPAVREKELAEINKKKSDESEKTKTAQNDITQVAKDIGEAIRGATLTAELLSKSALKIQLDIQGLASIEGNEEIKRKLEFIFAQLAGIKGRVEQVNGTPVPSTSVLTPAVRTTPAPHEGRGAPTYTK